MEKEKINQILANQAVMYEMLYKIQNPNKSTPKEWIIEEFQRKADEFKNLL